MVVVGAGEGGGEGDNAAESADGWHSRLAITLVTVRPLRVTRWHRGRLCQRVTLSGRTLTLAQAQPQAQTKSQVRATAPATAQGS